MNLDILIFQQINGLADKYPYLDALGVFFAEYLIYILGGAALLLFRKSLRKAAQTILAVVLARFGIAELIRLFWSRSRPFIGNDVNLLISQENTSSFPSGHASFCFALSYIVYHYNKKAGIIFFVASFLISIARVFVGVHWPSDILAGAVVGVFSGWVIIKLSQKF